MPRWSRLSVFGACFVVAAMVVGALAPGTAAAQTTQAVGPLCPVPVSSVTNGVDVCVDRGAGATYENGAPIRICVTVNVPQIAIFPPPPPPEVRVTNSVNGSPEVTILEARFNGESRCLNNTIQPPLGQEIIRAAVRGANGQVIAYDQVSFTSGPGGGGGGQTPAAPTALRATVLNNSSVRLDWTDTSQVEDGFRIFDGFTPIGTVGANVTSFVAGGLAPGSYHCFRVIAFNNGIQSAPSNWACVFVTGNVVTPPRAPTGLVATPLSASAIRLTWQDNSVVEDTYLVYNGLTLIATLGANSTSYVADGLPSASWNCFRVVAVNDGLSASSDWACAFTFAGGGGALGQPTGLRATVLSPTSLRLDWFDNATAETGYQIYNGYTLIGTTAPNATSAFVSGLAPGFYNCFRVVAVSGFGASPPSDWACAYGPPF